MSDLKIKLQRNVIRAVFVLLFAAVIVFFIERPLVENGTETSGYIVSKHRIPHIVAPTSDSYEIVIEYQVNGKVKRLVSSRAVWDTWGAFNTIGATVPVLYLNDGKAYINRFNYLYPITTSLLIISVLALLSTVLFLFMPQSRIKKIERQVNELKQAKNTTCRQLSPNRRHLLMHLHLLLFLAGVILLLAGIGIYLESPGLYITAIAGVVLWLVILKKTLVCPHCGASLKEDLQELDPLSGKTNWLIVRDNLARGLPVICSKCDRSLDD